MTMDGSSLLDSYHSIIEALAYESKFILDELRFLFIQILLIAILCEFITYLVLNDRIPELKKVLVSGGLAKNDLYMQVHADVLNTEVITFSLGEADLMLVGAALLAFHAIMGKELSVKIASYPKLEAKRFKPTEELQK